MREQYSRFDCELLKNDFLKRHYECLPFIGEEYEKSRLLLIGESHYVPPNEIFCVNREDFYDTSFDDLSEGEYKGWINTRSVFEYRVYDKGDFKNFFSNTATEIAKIINHTDDVSKDKRIEAMHQYAFMNYFKRPSYDEGETIRGITDKDYIYAYDISAYIIDVLNPRLIIFLSKKAYYAFYDSDQKRGLNSRFDIKCVSHPSSAWWNRKRKDGRCAREDFHDYVESVLEKHTSK